MAFTIAVNECNPEMLAERRRVNVKLEKITNEQIQWFDAPSPQEYRRWRKEGLHGYPKPFQHPTAEMIEIPSTKGKPIALRIIPPSGPSKGVYLHFHAGGFVIGSAASHDTLLARTAGNLSLVAVSVEYRRAPENPYPAAEEDCLEAALFALSDTGAARLGGPLRVIAGESAGGYLTIRTAIQLRNRGINIREKIAALVPGCGIFDLTYTPSMRSHQRRVIMGYQDTIKFIDSYVPPENYTSEKRKEPQISPLYDNLSNLPPALFLVGTVDPLIDDNVFMATKYHFAGNSTEVKLVAEACHAFTLFPGEVAEEGLREISHFLHKQLDRSMTTI